MNQGTGIAALLIAGDSENFFKSSEKKNLLITIFMSTSANSYNDSYPLLLLISAVLI